MPEFLNNQPELSEELKSVRPPKIIEQPTDNKNHQAEANISRRNFLKILGASAIGLAIGGNLKTEKPEQLPPLIINKPVDLPPKTEHIKAEQEVSSEFDPLLTPGFIAGITQKLGHEYLTINNLQTKEIIRYQLDNILWDEDKLYSTEDIAGSLADLEIQIRESNIIISLPRIKDKSQNKRFYFDRKKEFFIIPKGSGVENTPIKSQNRDILSSENQKYKTELAKRGWLPIYDYGYNTNKVLVSDSGGENRYFRIVDLKTMQDTPIFLQNNNTIFRGPIAWCNLLDDQEK